MKFILLLKIEFDFIKVGHEFESYIYFFNI